MSIKFGTSGLRGLAEDFHQELVAQYIFSFIDLYEKKSEKCIKKCFVAGDLRQSTPMIKNFVIQALNLRGYECFDAGAIPTPALAYTAQLNRALGVMITGSHIPSDRNGIKFYFPWGEILKEDEKEIVENLSCNTKNTLFEKGLIDEKNLSSKLKYYDAKEEYIKRYQDFFSSHIFKNKKIIIYEHSTVARDFLKEIFSYLGAEVISYGRSSKFIAVDTEALTALDELKKIVLEHHAFALISADGDGDRPLLLDEMGGLVLGDQIGILAAQALGANQVVTPLTTSSALELCGYFSFIYRCRVGSPFVIEQMKNLENKSMEKSMGKNQDIIVGFEANGGFLLGSDIYSRGKSIKALRTRDSLLPLLLVTTFAEERNLKISELVKTLPHRFTSSSLVKPYSCEKAQSALKFLEIQNESFYLENIDQSLKNLEEINVLDGVRVQFSNRDIIHFRPSGNAPEFRIYTESNSKEKALNLNQKATECLKNL